MNLTTTMLADLPPLFDAQFTAAKNEGLDGNLKPFLIAAPAFGRGQDGNLEPVRSIRTLLVIVGEVCSTSPEGAAEVDQLGTPGLFMKSNQAYLVGVHFLKLFLREIRAVICDEEKLRRANEDAGFDTKTVVGIIVGQAPNWMGLSGPVLSLLAALILVVIVRAGISTFCKMTDSEVISNVVDKAAFEDPNVDAKN